MQAWVEGKFVDADGTTRNGRTKLERRVAAYLKLELNLIMHRAKLKTPRPVRLSARIPDHPNCRCIVKPIDKE